MKAPETNRRLKAIMKEHSLPYKEVAEMLDVTVTTVTSWTRPEETKAFRPMPWNLLQLLELKLETR